MAVDLKAESKKIVDRFSKAGVQIEESDVETRLRLLIVEYKVLPQEAVKTVIGFFRQKHGISFDDMKGTQGPAGIVNIGDIRNTDDNRWVSLKAKVVTLWDPNSETIAQTGLIGDPTGTIKFTMFAKGADNHPVLEEGKSYQFSNLVTSIWQGQVSAKVNKNSEISELDEDIEVSRKLIEVTGVITSMSHGSGLIKRCPECNRALVKGACGEHGRVDGIYDLRIKAVIEPFRESKPIDLIIDAERTTQMTGLTLDKAKDMATEMLDQSVVMDYLSKLVIGRYYHVTGSELPSNAILVETVKPVTVASPELINKVIAEAV